MYSIGPKFATVVFLDETQIQISMITKSTMLYTMDKNNIQETNIHEK